MHKMSKSIDDQEKKKDLALEVSLHENDDDNEEEELDSLVNSRFPNPKRKGITKAPRHESTNVMKCYKCKEPENKIAICSLLQSKIDKFKRKKAMCAMSGTNLKESKEESDKEEAMVLFCGYKRKR